MDVDVALRTLRGLTILHGLVTAQEPLDIVTAEIDRLQKLVAAQKELIWHYEDQNDRNLFDDSDMPPELLELEKAVEAAEGKKPC